MRLEPQHLVILYFISRKIFIVFLISNSTLAIKTKMGKEKALDECTEEQVGLDYNLAKLDSGLAESPTGMVVDKTKK